MMKARLVTMLASLITILGGGATIIEAKVARAEQAACTYGYAAFCSVELCPVGYTRTCSNCSVEWCEDIIAYSCCNQGN